ncbi:ricin B lectin domain-containing protein [Mycena leptocephala]|nr:ricin B lectin domain-containing protein [Mycena leptocephala]
MISSTLIALVGLSLYVSAEQIQSANPAFFNAGIQGCIAVANNADGEPLIIHDCNTDDLANQDWEVSFFTRENSTPGPIKVFGDKCIDVTGGVNADNTKLQIWTCDTSEPNDNPNQQWISVTDSTFQWNGTNKCIDLTDGKITDSNVLQIYTCDSGNSNQKWAGEPNPDAARAYHVTGGDFSAGGGGPYCIAAASDTNGAEVALVACLNSDFHTTFPDGNITWSVPVAPLTGPLKTFDGKCLDVPNGSTANGVKLQIWDCAPGNTNQLFQTDGGQIKWVGQNKCLDLTDGNSTSGNPIQLWDCVVPDNNPNQDWFLSGV